MEPGDSLPYLQQPPTWTHPDTNTVHIQYLKPIGCTMILLINYWSDMFRPQFLAIFRELIILCRLYVNLFGRSFHICF